MSPNDDDSAHGGGSHHIPITIDKKPYKAVKEEMTGAELRSLPDPDVPVDRDLWLEMPGNQDDELVIPDNAIHLKSGMCFYTAPSTINPG